MAPSDFKTLLRTAQSYFPWAVDAKAKVQRDVRRLLRIPFERDFLYLGTLALPPGSVFVDVGGNRGQSIDAIRMLQPEAEIHSFEPNPLLAARLQHMFRNDRRVHIHPVGLGAEPGELTLYVPVYRGFVYDALASFDRVAAAEWLAGRIMGFRPDKLEIRSVHCRVATLDAFDLTPAFMKIDVQGWEGEVVRGGMQTLRRAQPTVLLETPDDELVAWMAAEGYAARVWDGERLKPGRGMLNTFFVRESPSLRL